jgi:hypothetical protein
MKPKTNRGGDPQKSNEFDRCQTPPYALDPILASLRREWVIWEPASGEGNIAHALTGRGHSVIASDILTGRNFFEWQPDHFDCIVTNPPYSIKYQWLERCYSLGKPFALLLPVETIGAARAQKLFERYGYEFVFLDKRVNFKMPMKGYEGNGAQFPVMWITSGLNIGRAVTFGKIVRRVESQWQLFDAVAESQFNSERIFTI